MRSDWYKSKEVQQRKSKHMVQDEAWYEAEATQSCEVCGAPLRPYSLDCPNQSEHARTRDRTPGDE